MTPGTTIAGWTVQETLGADGGLQRFAVVRNDGTRGQMEIAAANSSSAADLVARVRTLPETSVIDKGIDTFGNPYAVFVAPSAQAPIALAIPSAPTPNVAPAIPSARAPVGQSRSKIYYYIGGGFLVLLLINVAIRRGNKHEDDPPKEKFAIRSAHGGWGWECTSPFSISVETPGQARITALGTTFATDVSGRATISIMKAQLTGVDHVDLEATSEKGEKATKRVDVTPREVKLSEGHIEDGKLSFWDAKARVTNGAKIVDESLSLYSGEKADPPPVGSVSFLFRACGFEPGQSDQNGAHVTITEDRVRIDVDLFQIVLSSPKGKPPEQLAVSVSLPSTAGEYTVEIGGRFPVIGSDKGLYAKWAAVATTPIADAPIPSDAQRPHPIVVLVNGALHEEYLGSGSVVQAPYVVLVDNTSKVSGSCGPYGYDMYVKRYRASAKAKVYEARTGTLVGQGSFSGSSPSCPSSITTWNGSASDLYGELPDLTRFLARWR